MDGRTYVLIQRDVPSPPTIVNVGEPVGIFGGAVEPGSYLA